MAGIEVYVRHRSDGAMLVIHLDGLTKQRLIAAIQTGVFEEQDVPIALELSVLPEWVVANEPTHARIPIRSIVISDAE